MAHANTVLSLVSYKLNQPFDVCFLEKTKDTRFHQLTYFSFGNIKWFVYGRWSLTVLE